MIPRHIEQLVNEVVEQTREDINDYRFDSDDLYSRVAYLARQAIAAGRLDEIERIQKNTLDAGYDVWSQDDEGNLLSLTERQKAIS